MKKLLLMLLGALFAFPTFAADGDDFEYTNEGQTIIYTIISEAKKTVRIKKAKESADFFVLPEKVTYNEQEYTVTEIGEMAFGANLNGVEIPSSVTSIANYAFAFISYQGTMHSVVCHAVVPPICGAESFNELQFIILKVPEGSEEAYRNAICWKEMLPYGEGRDGLSFEYDGLKYTITSVIDKTVKLADGFVTLAANECSGELTIPSTAIYGKNSYTVTEIGEFSFAYNRDLKKVHFPSTLKIIGSHSFYGCPIKDITIPENVEIIKFGAFCAYPGNVENIICNATTPPLCEESVFYDEYDNGFYVINLRVPQEAEELYRNARIWKDMRFYGDIYNGQTFEYNDIYYQVLDVDAKTCVLNAGNTYVLSGDLEIPQTVYCEEKRLAVTSISDHAFFACSGITSVKIPSTVTYIGSYAFDGCASLSNIEIPESVQFISDGVFSGCRSLTSFHWPEWIPNIPNETFAFCTNLEKVYFSDNLKSFGERAFYYCTNLRSMIIPDGVKTIPANMLGGCRALQEILIPNSVTKIESYAFANCMGLRNIDLGTKVYDIDDYAFYGCENITDIHSMALNPPYAQQYTFPIDSYSKTTVTVQEQSLTRYKQENPWYRFENYMTVSGPISLSHYRVDMAGNEVFQLGVYGANSEIVWTSSNPAVAYANNCGLIVAMGITGSTVITAHVDGETINCEVVVSSIKRQVRAKARKAGASDEEETIDPVDIIMEGVSGNPPMVNVRLVPVGACTVIDWSSSNESLATVENGIVTVHGDGDVEFGASTENGLSESIEADTENIAGVEDITFDSDRESLNRPNDIYNLQGVCLKRNASQEDVDALAPGLYIIGGKKVLVK